MHTMKKKLAINRPSIFVWRNTQLLFGEVMKDSLI